MQATSSAPQDPIDAIAARLARDYVIKGELEWYFVRQIAAAQLTYDSLQRNIDKLLAAADVDDRRIDRLSRAQARVQRQQISALKELKDLQSRRNLRERFPEQTKAYPHLADHFCHIGNTPIVQPFHAKHAEAIADLEQLLKMPIPKPPTPPPSNRGTTSAR